jgi:hypothetical protein
MGSRRLITHSSSKRTPGVLWFPLKESAPSLPAFNKNHYTLYLGSYFVVFHFLLLILVSVQP